MLSREGGTTAAAAFGFGVIPQTVIHHPFRHRRRRKRRNTAGRRRCRRVHPERGMAARVRVASGAAQGRRPPGEDRGERLKRLVASRLQSPVKDDMVPHLSSVFDVVVSGVACDGPDADNRKAFLNVIIVVVNLSRLGKAKNMCQSIYFGGEVVLHCVKVLNLRSE